MSTNKCYLMLVVAAIILISCSPPVVNGQAVRPGPLVSTGQVETRDLGMSVENVWNCGNGGGTIVKHPSRGNSTNYSVEWEFGGTTGTGVIIGEGVISGGVDISESVKGHYRSQFDTGSQQGASWDLPAEANTIVDYTLSWYETWETGYIEVKLPNNSITKVNLRYRTNIGSEIVDKQVKSCGTSQPSPAQPTQAISPTASSSPTNVSSCLLKPCNISSDNMCVYAFAAQISSLIVTLKFKQPLNSSSQPQLVVGNQKFNCTIINTYPDRLYCSGAPAAGSTTLQVISPQNEILCSGTFTIPQYAPPSPTPKNPRKIYP